MFSYTNFVPLCVVVCLLLALQAASILPAQEVSPQSDSDSDSVSQWVSDLASADPRTRREAESKILDAGDESLPAVKLGLQSFDLEISNQCRVLLEKIEFRRRKRIAESFLAKDAQAGMDVELEAWPQFRAFIGSSDIPTRQLFLDICDTLPTVFQDYSIRGEQTVDALVEKASAVVVKSQSTEASPVVSAVTFLFLSKLASDLESKQQEPKALLDKADSISVVEFLSSDSVFGGLYDHESRAAIEPVVADWVLKQKAAGFVSDSELFRFVYETSNQTLLQDLKDRFDSFDASQKRKFIDVVVQVVSLEDEDWVSCSVWLEDALVDDTIAIQTRLKKDPSEKIEVSVGMLAEGVLASAIKQSVATGEPVKSEQLFGSYEFSGLSFSIVAEEAERKKLADYRDSKSNPNPNSKPNQQQ